MTADHSHSVSRCPAGILAALLAFMLALGAIPAHAKGAGKGDTDGDGLTNQLEAQYGTNKQNPDTDNDWLLDGEEIFVYFTDPADPDSDGDGLDDGYEVTTSHTIPYDGDTDDDGLLDGDELNFWQTDPLKADSDGDGASDYREVIAGTNPLDPKDYPNRR